MRLAVFLDAKGEGFDAPIFDLGDRPAVGGEKALELFGQRLRLAGRSRPDAPYRHARKEPCGPFFPCSRDAPTLSPSSPWKGSTGSDRRREHGKPGHRALHAAAINRRGTPSVQPPAGSIDWRAYTADPRQRKQNRRGPERMRYSGRPERQQLVRRKIVELAGFRPIRERTSRRFSAPAPQACAGSAGLRPASPRRASWCAKGRD